MHDVLDDLAPEVDVDAGWTALSGRLPRERRRRRVVQGGGVLLALALVAGARPCSSGTTAVTGPSRPVRPSSGPTTRRGRSASTSGGSGSAR